MLLTGREFQVPGDYRRYGFEEAVKAIRDKEKSRNANYPDEEATPQINTYPRDKFVDRVGEDLQETAGTDAN
jgi:hypothetical protein